MAEASLQMPARCRILRDKQHRWIPAWRGDRGGDYAGSASRHKQSVPATAHRLPVDQARDPSGVQSQPLRRPSGSVNRVAAAIGEGARWSTGRASFSRKLATEPRSPSTPGDADVERMHPCRRDSGRGSECAPLRGGLEARFPLGPLAPMPDLRPCRLLR